MNAADVELAISRTVNRRQNLLVSNVSWGLIAWGEIDLLQMSGSGYLTEYEIKVSRADLVREWQKRRWTVPTLRLQWQQRIKHYFVAIPESLLETCEALIPEWAGVAVAAHGRVRFVRHGVANKARPLNSGERYQLARLGALRYWRAAEALSARTPFREVA